MLATLRMPVNYKSSGVDIEAGDALVDWLAADAKKNASVLQNKLEFSKNLVDGIGGFASLFRMNFPKIKKPVLITCTDGVGTKVKLASRYQRFDQVGQDLVAMCVNDLICTGGFPLMFLDYYAVGKLELESAKQFLTGIKKACLDSRCMLVGGETAEMPGVYQGNDFDCAGFAVGIVDEDNILGAHRVKNNDIVVGIASSGFHSNGYSLLRKVFEKDLDQWIDQLLIPTRLYVELALSLHDLEKDLHALAHITGGGVENIPRVLPEGLQFKMQAWSLPDAFKEVQARANMSDSEMLTTLNCGVGLAVIVSPGFQAEVIQKAKNFGFEAFVIGSIQEGHNAKS